MFAGRSYPSLLINKKLNMKKLKQLYNPLAILLISFVLLMTSCDDKPDVAPTGSSIDQLLAAKPEFSIFQAALKRTRLDQFKKGPGPFTVFAPTNTAFAAININSESDLALLDSNFLVQILTYHIQAGGRSYTEIPLGPNATMSTQGGFTQYGARYLDGRGAYINGAAISGTGTAASNGFLYEVNRVLIPAFYSTSATLALNPDYKLMLQAFTKAAVSTTTNPMTIMLVSNSVMVANGYDSTTIANLTTTGIATLKSIMQYHQIAQRIFSPNFKSGTYKTVQGTNVTVAVNGTAITVKGTNNPSPFNVIPLDIPTTTGVLQGVSGLLKP
jgi:uncharacterized surface protein with fasciclin (FAS1) repeats